MAPLSREIPVQKLKTFHLIALVLCIAVLGTGAYLFNQHQQRKAEIELAQLALEQSKVQSQATDLTQVAAEPVDQGLSGIEGLTEDPATQTAHLEVNANEVAGALEAVEAAKAMQNIAPEPLSLAIDTDYHEGKTLSSNASKYGLKPMKTAPTELKATAQEIDQMLNAHLMEVWGRSSPDQVAKRVDGWSQQGNSMTYRTAWDSDRYQCTWYVVQWNKTNNQVLSEGYQPCF